MAHNDGPLGPLSRLLDAVVWLCTVITGILMVILIAIFGWLVWGRYVMNNTPTWVEQASLMMIVWITFLGAAVGVRKQVHLSIDFVREVFPRPIREVFTLISILGMVLFGAIMAWQGWLLMQTNMDRLVPMLDIAEGWRDLPIALCGVLTAVFSIEHLVGRINGRSKDA